MTWVTSLKVAIVEKNTDKINKLLDDLPKLEKAQEIEEVIYLLREASQLVHTLQDEASQSMKQIKKNLQFLRSTDIPTSKKLDIKS